MAIDLTEAETSENVLDPRLTKLIERTPAAIEQQVMQTSADSSLDELSAAIDSAEWLLCRAKTIDRLMKAIAIRWIDGHGEFSIGQTRYSAAFSTSVKCRDIKETGHAVLGAVGGDFDQFLITLVAQPYKHSTVRSFVDAKIYQSLFAVQRTARLVSGIPERTLKRTDTRFSPTHASH